MQLPFLPRNIERLADHQPFAFACHKGVSCFTHCCRQLELSLTPYDVLRMKQSCNLHSAEFLERYVIIEQEESDIFPRLYLTMIDDGQASCVFVGTEGCAVYDDRPGACRAYPLGRAARRLSDGALQEFYVLLKEDHCAGFAEEQLQTPLQYSEQQGLDAYNRMNDAMVPLTQHDRIRQGLRLTEMESELFLLALYDLDTFRAKLLDGHLGPLSSTEHEDLREDEKLLLYGIRWMEKMLFAENRG